MAMRPGDSVNGYQAFSSVEHDNGRLAMVRMAKRFDDADIVVDLL
jgi:hypothetical protein